MNRKGKFPQELTKKLLVLQEYFHSKTLTLDAVNELVGVYVQSVEQFDSSEQHLKYYFVEKIQFVLSRPEIIELLSGNKNTRESLYRMRDTVRGTVTPQIKFQNPVFNMTKKAKILVEEEIKYDEDLKRKQRSIKSQMYMDVEKQLKQQVPLLKAELVNQKKAQQKIKGIISNQQSQIQNRIKGRKKQERKSVEKVKQENVELPQYDDLKQMQQQIHENVTRFSVRQSIRQNRPPTITKQEPRNTIIKTKNGGKITIRDDDDD